MSWTPRLEPLVTFLVRRHLLRIRITSSTYTRALSARRPLSAPLVRLTRPILQQRRVRFTPYPRAFANVSV